MNGASGLGLALLVVIDSRFVHGTGYVRDCDVFLVNYHLMPG